MTAWRSDVRSSGGQRQLCQPSAVERGPLTRDLWPTKNCEPGGHSGDTREDIADIMSRSRSTSESSDNLDHLGLGGMCEVGEVKRGVSYDMDGKFSYSQVSMEWGCDESIVITLLSPGGQVWTDPEIQDNRWWEWKVPILLFRYETSSSGYDLIFKKWTNNPLI